MQRARTYIYTTALPPAVAAATRAALAGHAAASPGVARRVLAHATRVPRRGRATWACGSRRPQTPIQPMLLGSEAAALAAGAGAARRGALRAGDPAADRAGRQLQAARHLLGGAHRLRSRPQLVDALSRALAVAACSSEPARRDFAAWGRTSCCCTAGPCTAACGARGSTRLAEHARLHLVDLPGHGHSAVARRHRGLSADLARRVARRVPRGATAARLVAGRHGGARAGAPACRGTSRALVLVATTPKFVAGDGLGARHAGRGARWVRARARARLSRDGAEFPRPADSRRRAIDRRRCGCCAAGTSRRMARPTRGRWRPASTSCARADLRDDAPGHRALPALVIAGDHDRLTPAGAGRALAAALPRRGFARFRTQRPRAVPVAPGGPEVLLPGRSPGAFLRRRHELSTGAARQYGHEPRQPTRATARIMPDRAAGGAPTAFGRAAASTMRPPVLQAAGARRIARAAATSSACEPAAVLDLGTGTGHADAGTQAPLSRKPRSWRWTSPSPCCGEAGRRQTLLRRFRRVCADAACLPFQDRPLRHRLQQPDAAVVQRPGPCLRRMPPGAAAGRPADLRELGPDTLVELRRAWAAADPGTPT